MPMTNAEFQAYVERIALTPQARAYVEKARSSSPARSVQSGKERNTTWRYASRKMGLTLSGESSLEKNYHVLLDFDPEVIELWDQPPTVPLLMKDRNGCFRRVRHTPDVLVLTKQGIFIAQVKTTDKCKQLLADQPYRWKHDGATYQDQAAEDYFRPIPLKNSVLALERCRAKQPGPGSIDRKRSR